MYSLEAGNVPTIRNFEWIGLIPPEVGGGGRQRRFGADDVRRLGCIRHDREPGSEAMRFANDSTWLRIPTARRGSTTRSPACISAR
jgi:hypothetical protein